MQLIIRHETIYRYSAPLSYTIQQLRLSPRADAHQHTLSWNISTSGQRHAFFDAFGNVSHTLTVTGVHDQVRIVASGIVQMAPLDRGRLLDAGVISPLVFTVPTLLLEADETLRAFASAHLQSSPGTRHLLHLAEAIRDTVAYRTGATAVTSSARDALALGEGVCQDHAHLFLACCHVHGIPARYVSGYVDPGDTAHAATHAWIDAWAEDDGFSGWVSIDVTNACFASDAHCRIAVGRDYTSAAPVRGVRHGGGTESLSVKVDVSPQSR